MKDFFLVLLGFLLATVPRWLDRKRRLRGHFYAIRAELELCRERAETFLTDPVKSPLYRMPLQAFEVGSPILLAENALTEAEFKDLAIFYAQAEDINRGLNYAANVLDNQNQLDQEVQRLKLKATRLARSKPGEKSLYDNAKIILDTKIATSWWRY